MITPACIATVAPQEQAASGTTINVPYATSRNIRPDDILLCCIKTSGALLIATPTGFTDIFKHSNTADTLNPSVYWGWKRAVGGESGTLACTIQNFAAIGVIYAIAEIDLLAILDAVGTFKDGSTAAATIVQNSITPATYGALVLSIMGENSTAHTVTIDGGFTELCDRAAGTAVMEVAYLIQTTPAAAAPTCTISTGTAKMIGFQQAFKARPPTGAMLLVA